MITLSLHSLPAHTPAILESDAEPLANTGAGFLDHGFDPSAGMIAEALRVANHPLPELAPERVTRP